MFDDLKEKIRQTSNGKQLAKSTVVSPDVLEKLEQRGIDPENVTLQQLFPETLDSDGNDLSLMSGAEWEIMITYALIRKYLLETYPQSRQEAEMSGLEWLEEPEDPCQINIEQAKHDPKSRIFRKNLYQMGAIYDKVKVLQENVSEYEKFCLRLYWHLTYNWNHAPDVKSFREALRDCDIFEIVESYFNICRKYQVPTFEQPYYFLTEQQRLSVKLEGDMKKRLGGYCENEIHISILGDFA